MVSHIDEETPDPVLDERVRSVLDALAAPTEPGPLPGEVDAVAAFRAQHRTRRSSMSNLTPFRVAVASAVGAGLFLTGGAAAAATGSLPAAAQDVAHDVLAAVSINVPAGERPAADQEETTEVEETQETEVQPEDGTANDHGETVSDLAKDTDATGRDKGQEIAGTASQGRRTAGQETAASAREEHGDAPAGPETGKTRSAEAKQKAPVEVPEDDAATEDGATEDGATEDGTEDRPAVDGADTAGNGGGHSTSGSDNSGHP